MTVYQKLQQQFLKWDRAVEEQNEQLIAAATSLAKNFPKYLGLDDPSLVQLGVYDFAEFEGRELAEDDCAEDGAGELAFTIQLKVRPTNERTYEWTNNLSMKVSIEKTMFKFSVLALDGSTTRVAMLSPGSVQSASFERVYEQMVEDLCSYFDPSKVLRLS